MFTRNNEIHPVGTWNKDHQFKITPVVYVELSKDGWWVLALNSLLTTGKLPSGIKSFSEEHQTMALQAAKEYFIGAANVVASVL